MANQIALFKACVPILDEVYKEASKTAMLDGAPDLARAGANANELIIPKLDMQGLGDYNRNSGYVDGGVTLTNQTVTCNFDRGRMFTVDAMDDMESAGLAFGRLAGEFIRTKVAPEVDAFRFACYAAAPGISTTTGATLSDGAGVVAALRAAATKMDEDEVPMEGRLLFITPTLLGLVQDMDTTKSREVLARFESVTTVPQTRFYTAIEQLSGKPAAGEEGQDESIAARPFSSPSIWLPRSSSPNRTRMRMRGSSVTAWCVSPTSTRTRPRASICTPRRKRKGARQMGRVVGKVYPMEVAEPEAQRAAGGNGTCPETTGSRSGKPHRMSASGIHAKKEGGKRVAGKAEKKA